MKKIEKEIIDKLIGLSDEKYKEFQSKLMPTVNKDEILGVRVPILRSLAKEYKNNPEINKYISILPHKYYDEYNLHGFIISENKDFNSCISEVNDFLPYVNNWATCDTCSPKIFKKHKKELLPHIKAWIKSDATYTIRFGVEMLMSHFLDEDFNSKYLDLVAKIKSDEYYVNMMCAWFFATALAKQYDETIPYIEKRKLSTWVHNKTIQKAIESYRISDKQKEYLRSLKIKAG